MLFIELIKNRNVEDTKKIHALRILDELPTEKKIEDL